MATAAAMSISFFAGISFKIRNPKIYTNTRYKRLIRLVATTQSEEYIVRDNIIPITPTVFAVTSKHVYFFVNFLNSENSDFESIMITARAMIINDSVI